MEIRSLDNSQELVFLPNLKGRGFYVYFLWDEDQILYVGQTVNLLSRIGTHLNDKYFSRITYEVYMGVSREEILLIEKAYIDKFIPVFNGKTHSVLKSEDCCHIRVGGQSYVLERGVLDIGTYHAAYYNGDELFQYFKEQRLGKKVYICYIDSIEIGTYSFSPDDNVEFKVKDRRLDIHITKKPIPVISPRRNEIKKPDYSKPVVYSTIKSTRPLTLDSAYPLNPYKGQTVGQLIRTNPGTVMWFCKTVFVGDISKEVRDELGKYLYKK